MPNFRSSGMLLRKQNFLINGSHQNPGCRGQKLWISVLAEEDFMQWLARKDMKNGPFRNLLPLLQRQISKCIMLLQTRMKIRNYRDLNGIILSAKKTE